MALEWNYPRYPLEDNLADLLRLEQYWKYLLTVRPQDELRNSIGSVGDFIIVPIINCAQADYEAFHMVHSIGPNFDKYSKHGSIYSIRTLSNIPVCTFSVANNICIHARQLGNRPVDDATYDLLLKCCDILRIDCTLRDQL